MLSISKAISWSAIEKYSSQIVQFFIAILLARILEPNDYGILAMVMVVINILSIVNETGLGASLLQKLDRDILDESSVFYLNIFIGLLLYIFIFFISDNIEIFFSSSNLSDFIRVASLNIIINSLIIVPRVKLWINIDFKTQTKITLPAILISGITAITLAYIGYGIWALIIQLLLANIISLTLTWTYVRWKPILTFSIERIKPLFIFAYRLILARLINTIFNQSYSIIIGKYFSSPDLGFYNRAESIKTISSNTITGFIQRVSTPILCELQENHKEMRKTLLKFIVCTAHIVFPLMFLIFILSDSLIIILLTEKWLKSSIILKILAPVGLLFVINTFNLNVFNATGKTGLALKNEVYKKIIFFIILIYSIQFGFLYVIASLIIISIIEIIFNTYYTKIQIKLKPSDQFMALRGVLVSCLIMSIIVYFVVLNFENHFIKFFLGSFVGVLSYCIICWVFDVNYFKIIVNKIHALISKN